MSKPHVLVLGMATLMALGLGTTRALAQGSCGPSSKDRSSKDCSSKDRGAGKGRDSRSGAGRADRDLRGRDTYPSLTGKGDGWSRNMDLGVSRGFADWRASRGLDRADPRGGTDRGGRGDAWSRAEARGFGVTRAFEEWRQARGLSGPGLTDLPETTSQSPSKVKCVGLATLSTVTSLSCVTSTAGCVKSKDIMSCVGASNVCGNVFSESYNSCIRGD